MKRILLFSSLLIILTLSTFLLFQNRSKQAKYPIPSSGTMVKTDMEEKNNKVTRAQWIEHMHRTAPEQNWRDIEYSNSVIRQESTPMADRSRQLKARNSEEVFADGHLTGEWIERGSNNQAGSVFDIEFDKETNTMYLISAGGSIFKTDFDLQYWEVVNDRFTFSPGLLKIVLKEDGSKRMLALINKIPHFSDDLGLTWEKAAAFSADNWAHIKDAFVTNLNNQDLIFILLKSDYWSDFYLYVSSDLGETYQNIKRFYTSDGNNLAMSKLEATGDILLIEQTAQNESNIFKYDTTNNKLELLRNKSPFAFGEGGKGNLVSTRTAEEELNLISYNGNNEIYNSQDTGRTWTYLSTIPISPWDVRLFVSPSDPQVFLTGGVECYRSLNGGTTWELINAWWDYYDNVQLKLHADIMDFDEFEDQNGDKFITISNHGGLSISYDKSLTNTNIGLYDLNVSQYYSVRTSPKNPKLMIAGAQDQGLQRGIIIGKNTANLEQVISGDYGHNVFTLGGERFWTVYPGGWVSHYSYPASGYLDASWELNSNNETVWIPPIIQGPELDKDQVLMAGGNINGADGSHLIKLSFENGTILKEQLPFDFKSLSNSEISAMAISPVNRDKWFVATNNGQFYYSNDAGASYTKSLNNVPGSHYLYGSCVLPSKNDADLLYVSGSGYSTAGVIRSTNGGQQFEDISNGLPQTMVFGLAFNEDESLIFAATEAGPFVYVQETGQWYDFAGAITPTQSYWSVEYLNESKTVRFATYGRGVWDFDISDTEVFTAQLINEEPNNITIWPNPVKSDLTIEFDQIPQGTVTIECYDIQGKRIKSLSWPKNEKRVVWNLSELNKGIYVLQTHSNGKIYTRKFNKL
jgi:hypothetical protein